MGHPAAALEFFPHLPEDLAEYQPHLGRLVEGIRAAKCTPDQSHYEVREGVVLKNGALILGGNHEYGRTCGIHGEESLMANVLQQLGREHLDDVVALGILVHDTVIPQPCGNCRDVLAAYFLERGGCYRPDLPVLGIGPEKDGKTEIAVARLADYYVEDFTRFEGKLPRDVKRAVREAEKAYRFAYNLYGKDAATHPTGAAAIARRGRRKGLAGALDLLIGTKGIYPGTFVGDVAYHPLEAVAVAKGSAYAHGAADIEAMVIVAEEMPHVPYRQRQYLVEINPDLDVWLVSLSTGEAYITSPKEMLPNNFGPHNLGMTAQVEEWKAAMLQGQDI